MAIRLNAADTHVVMTALQIYREDELEKVRLDFHKVKQIERLIKSYKRSFAALERWGIK